MNLEVLGYLKFFFALVFVVALMLALSWAARRFSGGAGNFVRAGGDRRLKLVEQVVLDPRRRLVLVQRDSVQHLILLGVNGEMVLETGLKARAASTRKADEEGVDETRR